MSSGLEAGGSDSRPAVARSTEPRPIPEWSPREIVAELDHYVVGQAVAKRSVAIALRNRYRRKRVAPDLRAEILPTNILTIGPTGVGKTEIARRLARLAGAPFVKVEASKFTEVGYVGRDVESIVRDLIEIAIGMVRAERSERVKTRARKHVEERLLNLLLPRHRRSGTSQELDWNAERDSLRVKLRDGKLARRMVEIDIAPSRAAAQDFFRELGLNEAPNGMNDAFEHLFPTKKKRRRVSIEEAERLLLAEETRRMVDDEEVIPEAIERTENLGIVFLDEIDKIVGPRGSTGPEVSREGVQRDLLPIVEGSAVSTRYGVVHTDHVLFIAAGAFHHAKPSDLLPELQGRFPIRVELDSLGPKDFLRILTEPRNSLVRQYQALLATEGVHLEFTGEALVRLAAVAHEVNLAAENIGARRLHTVMNTLLEEILFTATELADREITIDQEMVDARLGGIVRNKDLSRYIL